MTKIQKAPLQLTYISIRRIIGILAMSLPIVVYLVAKIIFQQNLLSSISGYYYTPLGWFFVTTLLLISIFMFHYQGYDDTDRTFAMLISLLALSTAIFPTSPPGSLGLERCISPLFVFPGASEKTSMICDLTEIIHLGSASLMFLLIAYMSAFRFVLSEPSSDNTERIQGFGNILKYRVSTAVKTVKPAFRRLIRDLKGGGDKLPEKMSTDWSPRGNGNRKALRNKIYILCGQIILIAVLIMAMAELWKNIFTNTVYWGEFVSLFAFGVSWAVKGEAVFKDRGPQKDSRRFNRLQTRQYYGYKSGLWFVMFLIAVWFTTVLFAAGVSPFDVFSDQSGTVSTTSNFDGEEVSPKIYILNRDAFGSLSYQDEAGFSQRIEAILTLGNPTNTDIPVSLDVLFDTPCAVFSENDCVLLGLEQPLPVDKRQSITVPKSSSLDIFFQFPKEAISGEVVALGGDTVAAIPFQITDESATPPLLTDLILGFSQKDAQAILKGILFLLVALVFYFILNHQVLSLFWPLVRRNFRIDLGEDKDGENSKLWALFADRVHQMGVHPDFSINPGMTAKISTPATLTPEKSYLKTFFDLVNWIFPQFGYSLRMDKLSSSFKGVGLSVSVVKNDRKEAIAQKVLWATDFHLDKLNASQKIGKDKEGADTAQKIDDIFIYQMLMVPVYFWIADVSDRLDGFEPDDETWLAEAYAYLGSLTWHSHPDVSAAQYSRSINLNPDCYPGYAGLGRIWIEKAQAHWDDKVTAREYLLLANVYLNKAVQGLSRVNLLNPDQVGLYRVRVGAYYNRIVALKYLGEMGYPAHVSASDVLRCGRDLKRILCKDSANPLLEKETRQWLRLLTQTLEFVLQALRFKRNPQQNNKDVLIERAVKAFSYLGVDAVDKDDLLNPASPGRHFVDAHYRVQYNAACFYSQLSDHVSKGKDGKAAQKYCIDLALDHLEMVASSGGGIMEFAKKDSALAPIRDAVKRDGSLKKRYKALVGTEESSKDTPVTEKPVGKNKKDRSVFQRKDGQWANKLNAAKRASSLHPTQREAIDTARKMLKRQGGGELTIMGEDGKIRDKDTIAPGNDPAGISG